MWRVHFKPRTFFSRDFLRTVGMLISNVEKRSRFSETWPMVVIPATSNKLNLLSLLTWFFFIYLICSMCPSRSVPPLRLFVLLREVKIWWICKRHITFFSNQLDLGFHELLDYIHLSVKGNLLQNYMMHKPFKSSHSVPGNGKEDRGIMGLW